MKQFAARVKNIAETIRKTQSERALFSRSLKEQMGDRIVSTMEAAHFPFFRVVGVDGGLVRKSLHGYDFILTRAVGACLTYSNGCISGADYLPSRNPSPTPHVLESMSEMECAYYASLERMRAEVEAALGSFQAFSPDAILMDGMLFPHQSDRPPKGSEPYSSYSSLLESIRKLFQAVSASETILAGVIEDSRSNVFCNYLESLLLASGRTLDQLNMLRTSRDTDLLFSILDKGQMTVPLRYSENPREHPLLRDLPSEYSERMHYFYLKTARWDRPIKVDFLAKARPEDTAARIASVLMQVSGQHSRYGMPAPIIQADRIARLSEKDAENFYMEVLRLVGNAPGLLRLRREERPL